MARDDAHPWHWVVHTDSLDLYADRKPVFVPHRSVSPEDRRILLNCGGALHRAQVALAADGFGSTVRRLPDDDPSHVATITPTEPIAVTTEARERFAATGHTRGAGRTGVRPPQVAIDALVGAVEAEGLHVRLLDQTEVQTLASSTEVTRSVRGRVGRDDGGIYGVLYGESATPEAWLRAGEALSALWLEATRHGLAVSPSSSVVELRGGRNVMRTILPPDVTAYLAVRVDAADD
jgi:hypothetical protein